jgi:predicted nucleic acid-binding protein
LTDRFLVVDASVAIKSIFPEEGSDRARALRHSYRLVAPQIIYAECLNAVWKKVRRAELTKQEASKAAMFIDAMSVEAVSLRELIPLAIELSLTLDHPVYDCFYLALAIVQQCPVVTADVKLHRKVHAVLPAEYASRCVMLESFASASQ